jgi:hypothetical protein
MQDAQGERKAYRVFVGKPEGKRPLGRHRYRWEGSIKTTLKKYDGVFWI